MRVLNNIALFHRPTNSSEFVSLVLESDETTSKFSEDDTPSEATPSGFKTLSDNNIGVADVRRVAAVHAGYLILGKGGRVCVLRL